MRPFHLSDRFPALIQTSSGAAAIVLGLVVIVGWQSGSSTLTQVRPVSAAMQYVNALAFVIAGVGLLSAVACRDWVSGIAGLLTGVIGLLSLTQDVLSVDPGLDLVFGVTTYLTSGAGPIGRMPPNAALCVTFVGAAMFLRRVGSPPRMSMTTSLLGAATASVGLVALVGHASDLAPAYGWGRLTRMAVHTAAGFVVVGCGLVSRGWHDSPLHGGRTYRAPTLVGVASLTATIAVWYALVVHDRQRTFELIRTQAAYWQAVTTEPLEAQVRAVEQMAGRWTDPAAGRDEWAEDATLVLHSSPACHFIERIDLVSGQRWVLPDRPEVAPVDTRVRDAVLGAAISRRMTIVASERDYATGTMSSLVVVPAFQGGAPRGGVVALVRFDKLLERALSSHKEAGYNVTVFDGVRRIYGAAVTAEMPPEWTTEVDMTVRGAPLRLRVWPTAARLAQLEGRMPSLILAGGMLLSAVLACVTSFGGTIRRRERELHEAARRLREQITEREHAESALRASEERYRTLVDSASDLIYRVDPLGHFSFVNPVTTRVMSRSQSELIGLHFLELVSPEWRDRVAQFYAEQVNRRIAQTYLEFPAVTGAGEVVWIGQNVQLLSSEDTITGLQAVARDITERKRVDAEIARARDAALESDRLKSEFVANVSHELRTPLNGVLGLTELLLETDLTHEQREHATTVKECGETLLVLLNDILDLSKVAAGKLEIQTVAFDPRHLVKQTVDLFMDRARRKNVDLVCLIHHDVPEEILGDPGRCRQVLTNLLGNAVRFTDRGSITVRVSAERAADAGIALRVDVTDTGIGITPEAQARLFQPFVQADGSITRRYGGTGLGLVISRQLAELMGGEMGMKSAPGQGSMFWFTVRAVASEPSSSSRPHADLDGLRVLAVDDSESSRQRLTALLRSWRMTVTAEGTPKSALETLKAAATAGHPFPVVLVDLRNPASSPLEFAEAAHADGLVPPARLILLSGHGQPGDAQRAQQLGAWAYLTKPITPSDLLDCLTRVMASPPAALEPRVQPGRLVTRHTLGEDRFRQRHAPVLVVEDNLVNQKVLVGFLTRLGCQADVANNGAEALAALDGASYSLVLMDSQMPEMDGFATTAEIRRREGGSRRTVIVAVTAHAMQGERERCLAADMDDYLAKPVTLERLSAVLDRWLAAPAPDPVPRVRDEPNGDLDRVLDPIAIERLRELEADVPGLVAEVVSTFLSETPGRIDRIKDGVERSNPAAAEAAAHGLKGSAGAIGALRLSRLCAHVEDCSRTLSLDACLPSVATLNDEFRRVEAILRREYLRPAVR